MAQVKISADSGGGSVAIAGPASTTGNANLSYTLPDATTGGVIRTTTTPGAILQVVFASKTDISSGFSTLAWSDTGLEASITPTSTSSKILIQAKPCLSWEQGTTKMAAAIFKGSESDPLLRADAAGNRLRAHQGFYINTDSYIPIALALDYLDSPNTTSATTYKIRVSSLDNQGNVYLNRGSDNDADSSNVARVASTITLMEVTG